MTVHAPSAILALALTLVACGGSSSEPAAPVDVTPPPSAAQPPPTEQEKPAGDAPDAAYKADLETWCNAPSRAPGYATAPAADRARLVAVWVEANTKTKDFESFSQAVAILAPAERPARMRAELAAHGIQACPFVDEVEKGPPR